MARTGNGIPSGKFGADHGAYVPKDVSWTTVEGVRGGGGDHHRVWLRLRIPGSRYHRYILIGELRRYRLREDSTSKWPKNSSKCWRAFPEGLVTEFPKVFKNQFSALEYLKQCYLAHVVVETPPPPGPRKPASPEEKPPDWVRFFGEDPFDPLDDEADD